MATGHDFPDALTGGALAGAMGSPVLLTGRFHVPDEVQAVLDLLGAEEIVVLGGPSAVPEEQEEELTRHAGEPAPEGDEVRSTATGMCIRGFSRYDHEREYAGASTAEFIHQDAWAECSHVEVNIKSPGDFFPGGVFFGADDDGGTQSTCRGNVLRKRSSDSGYVSTYAYIAEDGARDDGLCATHAGVRDGDDPARDETATVLFEPETVGG